MIWQGFKFPNTGLPSLPQSFSSIHFNPLSHRQLLTVVRLLQPKKTTITEQYALKFYNRPSINFAVHVLV